MVNKKFELMLTRCAKAYSSSGSVVKLKIGMLMGVKMDYRYLNKTVCVCACVLRSSKNTPYRQTALLTEGSMSA